MTVIFACGHRVSVASNIGQPPNCPCGETRITRVSAPPPTFRGTCTGPHAVTVALEPGTVNLCQDGAAPLALKEKADG